MDGEGTPKWRPGFVEFWPTILVRRRLEACEGPNGELITIVEGYKMREDGLVPLGSAKIKAAGGSVDLLEMKRRGPEPRINPRSLRAARVVKVVDSESASTKETEA